MTVVLIIPTGLGATIGGHAGDANPVAKLLGACCDRLILHPNVVNASDINEMPENALYVEGSILDRFLEGKIGLRPVRTQNKILVVANAPITDDTRLAVDAARVTIGINATVEALKVPLRMIATKYRDGHASGIVIGVESLLEQISDMEFDALAIHTPIEVNRDVALNYYRHGGVNPWGGVEAVASKEIAEGINKPVAHAPVEMVTADDPELFEIAAEVTDPRIAPEAISRCFLHSVLKGLHRAPKVSRALASGCLSVNSVGALITPVGCFGRPHKAAIEHRIPVIAVRENRTVLDEAISGAIYVENYLEAAGLLMAMRAGVTAASVRARG